MFSAYVPNQQVIELPIRDGNWDRIDIYSMGERVIELPIRDGNWYG